MFGHLPLRHPQQYNPTAMTHTFNKKRFWLIVALLAVAEVLIIGLVLQWRYIFPSNEVSDLYKKYAEVDGVDATYIKGYKVNDSVFVDVTMLETKDSVVWDSLCEQLGILRFSMYPKEYKELMSVDHSFGLRHVIDTITKGPRREVIKNLVVFSHLKKSVCIFHNVNDSQFIPIYDMKLEEITY
jgi:hypothetical protein